MSNEGACCQACYTTSACLYWDYDLKSGICRLKPDQGGAIPPGQIIPGFWRDPDRVVGAKRGMYVRWGWRAGQCWTYLLDNVRPAPSRKERGVRPKD